MIDIWNLFAERDIQMQLWVLVIIMVGNFATWFAWKKKGSANPQITAYGFFKKLVLGFVAWFLFLVSFQEITNMGHIQVILPALSWGISAEYIGGAWVQQYIEKKVGGNNDKEDSEDEDSEEEKEDDEGGSDDDGKAVPEVKIEDDDDEEE